MLISFHKRFICRMLSELTCLEGHRSRSRERVPRERRLGGEAAAATAAWESPCGVEHRGRKLLRQMQWLVFVARRVGGRGTLHVSPWMGKQTQMLDCSWREANQSSTDRNCDTLWLYLWTAKKKKSRQYLGQNDSESLRQT